MFARYGIHVVVVLWTSTGTCDEMSAGVSVYGGKVVWVIAQILIVVACERGFVPAQPSTRVRVILY